MKNTILASVALSVAVIGLFLINGCTEQKPAENKVIVSPEKQEVVKEGYSGSNKPVVVSHKEFTGGGNKIKVINPEKQEIVKEGFSGSKPTVVGKTEEFVGAEKPVSVPEKTQGTPQLDTEKVIETIEKELETIEKELKELDKELK